TPSMLLRCRRTELVSSRDPQKHATSRKSMPPGLSAPHSITCRFAADSLIGGAHEMAGGVDPDRVGIALLWSIQGTMPQRLQRLGQSGIVLQPLDARLVGEPLMVQPWRVDR